MTRTGPIAFLAAALAMPLAAASPQAAISVSNPEPFVTETWSAQITFRLPPLEGRFAETCPLSAPSSSPFPSMLDEARTGISIYGFPVEDARFSQSTWRETDGGTNWWVVALVSEPIAAKRAGRTDIGPVTVEARIFDGRVKRGFFGAQPNIVARRFATGRVSVTVAEPPRDGRPAEYCGAIGSNVTARAWLDSNICTAGDPLILSLAIAGANDSGAILAPQIATAAGKDGIFRVDAASMKSRTGGDGRVFTWRVRARKAGTVEFPPLPVAYFDTAARRYRTIRTDPMPVQVKAGLQAALGTADGDGEEDDSYPMPDGIDLDFPVSGTSGFTFGRAVALAGRAESEKDFKAAAAAYGEYLGQNPAYARLMAFPFLALPGSSEAELLGRHCANLGSLRLMGGDARGALEAYSTASALAGDTPSLVRGIRAANARRLGNPRADLPAVRMFFPFWFRMPASARAAAAAGAVAIFLLLWLLAGKLGRGGMAAIAFTFFSAHEADAQLSFRSFFGGNNAGGTKAEVALEPAETVVGEPANLVFSFSSPNGAEAEELEFRGLPAEGDIAEYGQPGRLPPTGTGGSVKTRVALPVRFLKPFSGKLEIAVSGMLVSRQGNGTSFSFTSSSSFSARCKPLDLKVEAMPEEGRPADWSGAIGKNFNLALRLSPATARPGDLVTAEYTLGFDGYFPSNALPKTAGLDSGFKTYDIEETARTGSSVSWRQMIVPASSSSTNAIVAGIEYYDVAAKRYQTAKTRPVRLAFAADTAASTENTAILVDAQDGTKAAATGVSAEPATLRFAPGDSSPAVARLPPGAKTRTLAVRGAWQRVECAAPPAIGWMKQPQQR